MTNEHPTVTEATVLGENCGCCEHWYVEYDFQMRTFDGSNVSITFHCGANLEDIIWDADGNPTQGTDHPPGQSVCPAFEAQE